MKGRYVWLHSIVHMHSPIKVDGPGAMFTLYLASYEAFVREELVRSSLMEMRVGGVRTVPCLLCTKHE